MLCHHSDKFCEYRRFDSGDLLLICNVSSCDYILTGLCEFISGIFSR